jgi:hypothetical protein
LSLQGLPRCSFLSQAPFCRGRTLGRFRRTLGRLGCTLFCFGCCLVIARQTHSRCVVEHRQLTFFQLEDDAELLSDDSSFRVWIHVKLLVRI